MQAGSSCGLTCNNATGFAATLLPNSTWADVDYNGRDLTNWQPMVHMERIMTMLRAANCPICTSVNTTRLFEASHSAFLWWVTKRLSGSQWWWQQIGEPEYVGASAILLGKSLTSAEEAGAVAILSQTDPSHQDGQNLVWELAVDINRAVITGNSSLAASRFNWLWQTFEVVSNGADGVQPDESFYFHGHLLQSGAYGSDYAINGATLAAMAVGTQYAASETAFDVIAKYIGMGQAAMVYTGPAGAVDAGVRTVYDPLVKGREIVRPPNGSLEFPSLVMGWAMDLLRSSDTDPALAALLGSMSDRIQGRANATVQPRANVFWNSLYASNVRKNFFQGVKVLAERMDGGECVNSENQLGWHMSDGLVLSMVRTNEYDGVFPAWDWDSLPGLSTVRGVEESPCSAVKRPGDTTFDGGVASATGETALMLSDYTSGQFASSPQPQAEALKAWFLLPEGTVAVSHNLRVRVPGSTAPVPLAASQHFSTTLEQRRLTGDGEVWVGTLGGAGARGSRLPPGQRDLSNSTWVWHDSTVWSVLPPSFLPPGVSAPASPAVADAGGLFVLNTDMPGNYHNISGEDPSNMTVAVPMLLVRTDHSAAQAQAGTDFAYAVLPAAADAPAKAAAVVTDLVARLAVVSNNDNATVAVYTAQAPSKTTTVFAAIWQPSAMASAAPAGLSLSNASAAFALIIEDLGNGTVWFSAADPQAAAPSSSVDFGSLSSVSITIDRELSGCTGAVTGVVEALASPQQSGSTRVTIALPSGMASGGPGVGSCTAD